MVTLGKITGWQPSAGSVTTWMASAAAHEAARNARRSDLPPSYQRARHLRATYDGQAMGKQLPRLMVWIQPPTARAMMVSFIDSALPAAELLDDSNFGTYADNLSHGGINLWINRHADKSRATISFPDDAEARASVQHIFESLARSFARAVKTTSDWVDAVAAHANCGHRTPTVNV